MKKQSVKFIIKESNINFHNWYTTAESFSHPVLKKYAGTAIGDWVMKVENDMGYWGPPADAWQATGEILHRKLLDGKLPLDKYFNDHIRIGKKIFSFCDEILSYGIKNASMPKISGWLNKLWRDYSYLNGIGFVAVISDFEHNLLTNKLTEIIRLRGGDNSDLSLLVSPNKKTLYWQEQLELLQLCAKHKNGNQLFSGKDFKNHIQKYFWLNYGYQGPAWSEQDFVERAQNFMKQKGSNKILNEHKNYFTKLIYDQKQLAARLGLNGREKYLFAIARDFTYLKGFRIETRHRYSFVLDSLFGEIGRRFFLPLTFFRYATKKEILAALKGKEINSQKIISRKKLMLYVFENSQGKFTELKSIGKFLDHVLVKETVPRHNTITGQTAYPGIARGRIRIVESVKDLSKVSHGDILVAHGTNPDFLPAMYRASAFVTDQGGITSHAAIVSRELKKPCIIGAKHATSAFHDGDLVEVDADHGIVKKI